VPEVIGTDELKNARIRDSDLSDPVLERWGVERH